MPVPGKKDDRLNTAKLPRPAKKNKGQVTHIYKQVIDISMADITRHRRLYGYLITLFRNGCFKKSISPLSHQLLENISTLTFVPGLLQAWTCCRFCELKQIGIQNIMTNSPFVIKSSKSDHIRSVNRLPLQQLPQLRKLNPSTKILVVSYDSYKNSIKQARRRLKMIKINGILDCTHVWRHFEASWQFSQNVPLANISHCLGHVSDKTTLGYIHPELEG